MDSQKIEKIAKEIVDYLSADPSNTTNVKNWAWAYSAHSTAITPIFNKLVKSGQIEEAYLSCVGNKVYKAPTKTFLKVVG